MEIEEFDSRTWVLLEGDETPGDALSALGNGADQKPFAEVTVPMRTIADLQAFHLCVIRTDDGEGVDHPVVMGHKDGLANTLLGQAWQILAGYTAGATVDYAPAPACVANTKRKISWMKTNAPT